MKNKFYSKLMSLALVFVLVASVAYAQDFNNTGGSATYTTTLPSSNPILRMKASGGLITGIGDSYANRVVGTVVWGTGCSNPFEINPTGTGGDFYYTNMTVEGDADKTFDGDVFIAGNYAHTGTGETDHTTNDVTFTFNGMTGTQTIAGDNTTNGTGYNNLVLTGDAAKEIATGTLAEIVGNFLQDASATGGTLTVDGTLTFTGAGNSIAFNDELVVSSTGTVNMGASNSAFTDLVTNEGIFNGGTGDMAFEDFINDGDGVGGDGFFLSAGDGDAQFVNFTQDGGDLNVVGGEDILVSGAFNANGGTITLACTSNFTYNGTGAQTLAGKANVNFAYGNLILDGTGLVSGDSDVDICNDFSSNREVDMWVAGADHLLSMLNSNGGASASYTGDVEVLGSMRWAAIEDGVAHTYNNTNTILTFGAGSGAGLTDGFTLTVRPATTPNVQFAAATDINRKITGTYAGTGSITAITMQWDATDELPTFAGLDEDFRFAEGYNGAQPGQTIAISGATYGTANASSTPRYLSYSGGTGSLALLAGTAPGTTQQFISGDDFVLTTTPMEVNSITKGRWSDPGTWDIGIMPEAKHNVNIWHIVYTGDATGPYGTNPYAADERNGALAGDLGASANRIIIKDVDNASLIIGNQDPTMGSQVSAGEYLFRTRIVNDTQYINNQNTDANTGDGDGNVATGLNGIWVRVDNGVFTPVLGTFLLNNAGDITNNSIIEVGICQ